jgi:hypothetical protein
VEWSTWSTSAASLYFHLIFCLCGWFRCSLFSEFLPGREGVKDQAPCLIGTGMTNLLSQFVKLLAFPLGSHVAYRWLIGSGVFITGLNPNCENRWLRPYFILLQ